MREEKALTDFVSRHIGFPDEFVRRIPLRNGSRSRSVAERFTTPQKTAPEMALAFLGPTGVVAWRAHYGGTEYDAIWRLIASCLQVDPEQRNVREPAHALLFARGTDRCSVPALEDATFLSSTHPEHARFRASALVRRLLPTLAPETHLMASSVLFLLGQYADELQVDPVALLRDAQPQEEEKKKTPPRSLSPTAKQLAQEWVLACADFAAKHLNDYPPLPTQQAALPWMTDASALRRVAQHEQRMLEVVKSAWIDYLGPPVAAPDRFF